MMIGLLFLAYVLQVENKLFPKPEKDCGVVCVYTLLVAQKSEPMKGYTDFRRSVEIYSELGTSFEQLQKIVSENGLHAVLVEAKVSDLRKYVDEFGVIGQVNGNHFIIVSSIGLRQVELVDPVHGTSHVQFLNSSHGLEE